MHQADEMVVTVCVNRRRTALRLKSKSYSIKLLNLKLSLVTAGESRGQDTPRATGLTLSSHGRLWRNVPISLLNNESSILGAFRPEMQNPHPSHRVWIWSLSKSWPKSSIMSPLPETSYQLRVVIRGYARPFSTPPTS